MKIALCIMMMIGSSYAMDDDNAHSFVSLDYSKDAQYFEEVLQQLEKRYADMVEKQKVRSNILKGPFKRKKSGEVVALEEIVQEYSELTQGMLEVLRYCMDRKKNNASNDITYY